MRSTFLGIETSKRGLAANQKGLDITGNNVVNVNTEGYTRQRVDFSSVSLDGYNYLYSDGKIGQAGQGVQMNGVSQIRDLFLDKRYRDESATTAYYDSAVTILTGIQDAFDEISNDGLKVVFEEAITSLQNFTQSKDQTIYANIVKSSINNVNLMLQQYNKQLNDVIDQQIYDCSVLVDSTNVCLQKIADLNAVFLKENTGEISGMYTSNELQDQRNLLLDELATYGNINVTYETDGTVSIEMNGHGVLSGTKADMLVMDTKDDKSIAITWKTTGENISLTGGSLKANLDYINGSDSFTKGVPYYIKQLDSFASTFANIMNTSIKEKVKDADGNFIVDANGDFVTQYKQLVEPYSGDVIDSSNIRIGSKWLDDPAYIMSDAIDGTLQNTDVLNLISRLEGNVNIGTYSGTLSDFVDTYNTDVGEDIVFNTSRFKASYAVSTDLDNRRDAISGVSLDEEGSNLIRYEKAYNAVARVMTAMDEALNVLINSTGLVGRG